MLKTVLKNEFQYSDYVNLKLDVFIYFLLVFLTNTLSAQVMKEDAPVGFESQLIEASKQEQIGNPDKAIELLEKMRSIRECKSTVYYKLAKLYYSKSRLEDALNAINESEQADPTNKWIRIYQANIYESFGRYGNAAQSYESLAQLEPENYTMYDLAALNYIKSNLPSKAILILDKAIEKFGLLPQVCIKKSRILYNEKKYKKSIEILIQSLKDYPKHDELYIELFDIYKNQSDTENAKQILEKLRIVNPSHPIFNTETHQNNYDSYFNNILIKINQANSNLDESIKLIIPLLSDNNNITFEKLENLTKLLIEKYPNDPKVWALKGDLDMKNDSYLHAIEAYKHSTELGQVPYSVWENLAVCQMRMTHWNSLIKSMNVALDYYPNQSFLYYALAQAYYHISDLESAKNQIKQFELMNNNKPDRLVEADIIMAKIFDSQGDFKKADELWEKCMNSNYNESAYLEYAYSQARLGKSISQSILEKLTQTKNLYPPYTLNRRAFIAFYQKDFPLALQILKDSLQYKSSKNQEIYELAYRIYFELKDIENAKLMLNNAIEVGDNKPYYLGLLNKMN